MCNDFPKGTSIKLTQNRNLTKGRIPGSDIEVQGFAPEGTTGITVGDVQDGEVAVQLELDSVPRNTEWNIPLDALEPLPDA